MTWERQKVRVSPESSPLSLPLQNLATARSTLVHCSLIARCRLLHTRNHERSDEATVRINKATLGRLLPQEQDHWKANQPQNARPKRSATTSPSPQRH